MKTRKLFWGVLCSIVACISFASEKYPLSPSNTASENITSTRSQIVLNGVWEFAPAFEPRGRPDAENFGRILVPGFWRCGGNAPTVVYAPNVPSWKDYKKAKIGWYKRSIEIPQDWNGRAIFLRLERVYSDAVVFVDGQYAGAVRNHEGDVDLTKFAKAGKKIELAVKVSALLHLGDFNKLSKMSAERLNKLKAHHLPGISGDVILFSRPIGVHIDGMFIRTSVRRMELSADVEIKGVLHSGDYQFKAKVFDKNGKCVKEFSQTKFLEKSAFQVATVSSVWENPQLWDIDSPTLYNLEVSISKDEKLFDSFKDRFGFREFEISGKDFLLNGKKIHLQPLHCFWEGDVGGSRTAIANSIDSMMRNNFNTMELWPWEQSARGATHCRPTWAKIADEKGFLMFYPANGLDEGVWRGKWMSKYDWSNPNTVKKWYKTTIAQWKPIRNCPSVVAFMTMPNRFSVRQDQSPMVIGNRARLQGSADWLDNTLEANKILLKLKSIDSTRPIASHDGGNVGDFHGMNHYLDFIPLQEREEWLSQWSATGTMPYMAIEFGTPFICNFQRDRSNPYRAWCSEPLLTEYCAAYFGDYAYENESQAYRDMIAKEHVKDLLWKKLVNLVPFEFAKNNAEFQALFIKNTWRSWRTYGISGGMVPWRDSYGWEPIYEKVEHPYKDGALGWQPQKMSKRAFYGMGGKGAKENASAKALIENMKPALMWIAGKKDAFTDKTHHFFSGEKIQKQIVAINDLRKEANYNFDWKIVVADKTIASGNLKGIAKVAERVFLPIEESLPSVDAKMRGEIVVNGTFGGEKCSDKFAFAVYPQAKFKSPKKLYVSDATGSTIALLKKFGADFEVWDGLKKDGILIIGENSYEKTKGDLKEFVEAGGKVLLLGQSVETLENLCGFRASRFVERRVFPIKSQASHPIIKGMGADDFRDWAGEGTQVERFKHVDKQNVSGASKPKYGYHWGNRGSVASVMVEKPHYSSWRAIVEGQFDLAFTPLMEREFGRGIALFCAFDVAGRTQRDPVADELFCRIISYLDNFTPTKEASSVATYIGGEKGEAFLKSIGMKFTKVNGLSKKGLVVIGENSGLTDEQISSALESGANIILIERMQEGSRLGLKIAKGKITKQIKVPAWEEAIGLSIGDVHTRTDIKCNTFEGGDVSLCGTLARIKKGKGTLLAFSILADELDTKKKTYLRTTAWRMQRTFAQLAGSLGASFKYDNWIFNNSNSNIVAQKVLMNGIWAFSYKSNIKSGNPEAVDFDDSKWERSEFSKNIDEFGNSRAPYKETYWNRKNVFIPKSWKNKNITMYLGKITGGDSIYINGKKVAGTKKDPHSWEITREYKIPNSAIKFGEDNLIAICVEAYSSGRIYVKDEDLCMKADVDSQYSPDYIENHPDGDSPFRYMKW